MSMHTLTDILDKIEVERSLTLQSTIEINRQTRIVASFQLITYRGGGGGDLWAILKDIIS